ncbi:PRTRC system protein E [Mucilaginibacter sp. AW1-7]|jgi:PRTRC genetic system protein E|uniref:PRTRC system protein E n=1 Tax=Mucilaginibacter sp. AW1-7 TaxID=3349874 RepID=UPI003F741E8A
MKTNFFEHIAGLGITADLKIAVSFGANGNLVVSVMVANDKLSDKAGKIIQPMILRGNAGELDEGFFEAVSTPLKQTSQLFANMDAYQKGLDDAKLASKQEQDKKNKNGKAKTGAEESDEDNESNSENLFSNKQAEEQQKADKKKAYDEAMLQIAELAKTFKYAEAIALLPSVDEYPEKVKELKEKADELAKRKKIYDSISQDL